MGEPRIELPSWETWKDRGDVLAKALESIADGTWTTGISSAHGKYLKYLRDFARRELERADALTPTREDG